MESFARHAFRQMDSPLVDTDAAFMLSFSLMMLQTDLHSQSVKVCDT